SVLPSPFRSPAKHRSAIDVAGAGPLQVEVVHPLPVDTPTDQLPEPEAVSHHMSVLPSPFRSPAKHRSATDVAGAGPLQVEVVHPLPVDKPTDQLPEPETVSHHISVLPSPFRSPAKHRSATGVAGAGPLQVEVALPLPLPISTDQLPEPEAVSHHMSVTPSPFRSPAKHRSATDVAGAGPF